MVRKTNKPNTWNGEISNMLQPEKEENDRIESVQNKIEGKTCRDFLSYFSVLTFSQF